ncbi:hypothetical protein Pint_19106 [Pistacia integerrima]|uniref:Uncharacterized protein n=1 Tax=Pistacia integerrima TaxID=434235 RepID=A0ACC0YWK7_9ROSI|nr:hypothetical protein Pint_19106 [Pistacia integerrima]
MAQCFYRKQLTPSDVKYKLEVKTDNLGEFPLFPPGQHFQNLRFLDEEEGTVYNFPLAVRQIGPAYIGGDWIKFCKKRKLEAGRVILFFKDEAAEQQSTCAEVLCAPSTCRNDGSVAWWVWVVAPWHLVVAAPSKNNISYHSVLAGGMCTAEGGG